MIRCAALLELRWPLAEHTGNANSRWSERESLVVALRDDAGRMGLGEAAPLPGFSPDTLQEAAGALQGLVGRTLPEPLPGEEVGARLATAVPAKLGGAARHALESALLDLWARQAGVPAWRLLAPDAVAAAPVPVACLLPSEHAAALARARDAAAAGCRTFKVKLRPGELRSDAELLRSLRRELGDGVALRADANQSLTQRLIDPQLADLRAVRLEWLEEPWPEAAQSPPPGLPLALDESLLLPGKGGLGGSGRGAVAALVLKPSLLGGLVATHAWLTAARLLGKAAVVSHQLEGPVGFQSAAALALAHTRAGPAQGLGAHPALAAFPRPAALARQGHALRYYQEPGLGVGLDSLRPFVQRVAGDAA